MSRNEVASEPRIDEDFVPVPGPAVHTVEVDGEAILLDEPRERLHHLNASATLIWQCFDGIATIGAIVSDLSDVIGEERDTVLADTLAVTQRLQAEGLLDAERAARSREDHST